MIIDWQHHYSPEEIYRRRGGKPGLPVMKDGKIGQYLREQVYQIDKHLEFMDAAGIDVAVLSATLESVEDCRLTDDPQGVRDYIENIRKLDLPPESIEDMLGSNAAKLLGI